MKSFLISILLLGLSFPLLAQGGLIIEENTHVVIQGSPNLIIHNGKFVNDGNFSADNSTLIMAGSAPTEHSTIGGASSTIFNHLKIDKSNHDVRLDYDIEVAGDIQMEEGLLILNYSDIILGGSIIDETETSRITGPEGGAIIKTVELNAPSGMNPGNLGIEISTDINLGATMIRRSHVPMQNENNQSINRFFSIAPENNWDLDATLRMFYFDAELNGQPEEDLNLWRFDDIEWLSFGAEVADQNENWVEVSGVPFFHQFTLAEEMEGALPVELLAFNASVNERKEVALTWTTVTEINNDYFTIERSKNGIDFEAIQEVPGAGTTNQPLVYDAIDPNPYLGTSYYRLRQTDFDGTQSLSEIRSVHIDLNHQFTVYPNPMKEVLHVVNDGSYQGKAIVKITDAVGRVRYQNSIELDDQVTRIDIHEVNEFESGNYYLVLYTADEIINFNLVKVEK